MGTPSPTCLALVLALSGCAGTADHATLGELQKRLDESERRTATAEHKIDELENRVFLLTDQVESQKVAALHRDRPRLPVVTLKPDEAPASGGAGDVSFEGEAASPDPDHTRTVLRIDGTRVASHHTSAAATARGDGARAEPPAEPPEENLGVAPAPPIRAAADKGAAHADQSAAHAADDKAAPSERSAPAGEPLALYRAAYEELRAGRHDAAERGFRDFVKRFPHHDYADNAQYWLGETFYDRKQYDRAAPEFRAVVTRWPTGNKAPDALLKLAYCLLAEGDAGKGRSLLREVPATYPHTDAARLAEERLAQLHPTEATP
jgi:tol-pal system protein YbgF